MSFTNLFSSAFNQEHYSKLYEASCSDEFFDTLAKTLKWETPYSSLNHETNTGAETWFTGGKLNYLDQISSETTIKIEKNGKLSELDYSTLMVKTEKAIGLLLSKGIDEGSRVLICVDDREAALITSLACLGLGAQFGFAYQNIPTKALNKLISAIQPNCFLYEEAVRSDHEPLPSQILPKVVLSVQDIISSSSPRVAARAHSSSKPTSFLINSGTTGKSRIVQSGLPGSFMLGKLFLSQFLTDEKFWIPLDFAWGVTFCFSVFPALLSGKQVILTSTRFKPDTTFLNIPDSAILPPSMLNTLPTIPFESLALVGEPISPIQYEQNKKKMSPKIKVTVGYGQNEASTVLLFAQIYETPMVPLKPFYGVEIKQSQDNELLVRNKLPTLTPSFLLGDDYEDIWTEDKKWLRTGDAVKIVNASIIFSGRLDRSIKRKGRSLDLESLERFIKDNFQCDCLSCFDKQKKLLLYIEGNYNESSLSHEIAKEFGKYAVPDLIIRVQQFKRTSKGTILRQEYLNQAMGRSDGQKD